MKKQTTGALLLLVVGLASIAAVYFLKPYFEEREQRRTSDAGQVKGEITIVRPLYYLEKPRILAWLRQLGIRPVRNNCPFERTGTRQKFRRFLDRLYRDDSRIRTNIFWGIHNLKPQYLPRPVSPRRKHKTAGRKPA